VVITRRRIRQRYRWPLWYRCGGPSPEWIATVSFASAEGQCGTTMFRATKRASGGVPLCLPPEQDYRRRKPYAPAFSILFETADWTQAGNDLPMAAASCHALSALRPRSAPGMHQSLLERSSVRELSADPMSAAWLWSDQSSVVIAPRLTAVAMSCLRRKFRRILGLCKDFFFFGHSNGLLCVRSHDASVKYRGTEKNQRIVIYDESRFTSCKTWLTSFSKELRIGASAFLDVFPTCA